MHEKLYPIANKPGGAMRRETSSKTCSLGGASDLTVIAPIRKGLVSALEAVTYKSRVKRVLRTLHAGRSASHESELIRVLSDAVERVGRIHSVRIAVIEPGDQVLLAVTFDGAWESYVRVIWQKVSRLLDLIFCNTEEYVTGWDHSFDEWGRWLRRRQVETSFLYSTPGFSADDQRYLRMQEHLQRRSPDNDLHIGRVRVPSAERIARELVDHAIDMTSPVFGQTGDQHVVGRHAVRQGLRGVVGLHRLSDVFPPGHADAILLHRAARELLPEFLLMLDDSAYQVPIYNRTDRFGEALDWFRRDAERLPHTRETLSPGQGAAIDADDVQGGIVNAYTVVTHGALLLLAFQDRAAVGRCLTQLNVTSDAAATGTRAGDIVWNIAFTVDGLRMAGLDEDETAWFPEDFLQGMQARAGLLGDLRTNHPRRWRLPTLNWLDGANAVDRPEHDTMRAQLELEAVHAVVQVRTGPDNASGSAPRVRLYAALEALVAASPGTEPLSIQWMQRNADASGRFIEHFGFTDGESQPVLSGGATGQNYDNRALPGEVLLGHPNRGDIVCPYTDSEGRSAEESMRRRALFRNGSFLVVRKLRQDLRVMKGVLDAAQAEGIDPLLASAKMMGRWPAKHPTLAGQPLASPTAGSLNDFVFDDVDGHRCPLHAHIRRANPRLPIDNGEPPGARPPRLVRRGMPYGLAHDPNLPQDQQQESLERERGLVFMTFNASIGEQFEVVQRWLTGGNSAGGFSGHSDPFCGLAEPGRKRFFAFEEGSVRRRIALDGSDVMGEEPEPLVRLEWGAYFFAPSLTSLTWLRARAEASVEAKSAVEWRCVVGEQEILRLLELERLHGATVAALGWKATLEDPEAVALHVSASVWAAIRGNHGGALRTPYGVLVASRRLVDAVLTDPSRRYSATGYLPRMRRSIGAIYLGLDDDPDDGEYQRQSAACNSAIQAITFAEARALAEGATQSAIEAFARNEHDLEADEPPDGPDKRWQLTLDVRELVDAVLARLSEEWFGLQDGGAFRRGGFRWDWVAGSAPCYPGHFTAPSRYFFQPLPGGDVERLGQAHGQALTKAMLEAIENREVDRTKPISAAVLGSPIGAEDPGLAARTLVGALMGFLPTTDGNLRRIFNEWMRDGTLWQLRAAVSAAPATATCALDDRLKAPIRKAMQLRPVPELIWRSAAAAHQMELDDGTSLVVASGEQVVLALVSATQQAYEQGTDSAPGEPDVSPIFGGVRGPGGPTHACPGYGAAMGVLFGFFRALVTCPYPLRPGPSVTSLYTEGPVVLPGLESVTAMDTALKLERDCARPVWARPGGAFELTARGTFANPVSAMAIGDSWLVDWPPRLWPSLFAQLSLKGYDISANNSKPGLRLAEFFLPTGQPLIEDICRKYQAALGGANPPRVVFVSAGGNDVTYRKVGEPAQVLCSLLKPKRAGANVLDAINDPELVKFLAGLEGNYIKLFTRLLTVAPTVPLVIHGYDHPLPELSGGRLSKCILENRWSLAEGRTIMATLIDCLNSTIAGCAAQFPDQVQHVNLCGKLQALADLNFVGDVRSLWRDDLHANTVGFAHLAGEITAVLPATIVPS